MWPVVAAVGAGILGAYSSSKSNSKAKKEKRKLKREADKIQALYSPVQTGLNQYYKPGGLAESTAAGQQTAAGARAGGIERAVRGAQAWRSGGARSGALQNTPERGWSQFAGYAPVAGGLAGAQGRMSMDAYSRGAKYEALPSQYDFSSGLEGWMAAAKGFADMYGQTKYGGGAK